MPTTKIRKSVPLDTADLERVARLNVDPQLREVIEHRLGRTAPVTEAQLMHLLVVAGLKALEEEADESRYEALAASENDEDRAYRAASRSRRRDAE